MSKRETKEFLRTLRSLTVLGATIVLLGHTNKYPGSNGKVIFEGVMDVLNDVDDLFYLQSTFKDERGIAKVMFVPEKVRFVSKVEGFAIDVNAMRVIALNAAVDVAGIRDAQVHRKEDQPIIDQVRHALLLRGMNHTGLVEVVASKSGAPERRVREVIDRYSAKDPKDGAALWIETRRLNNARHIELQAQQ